MSWGFVAATGAGLASSYFGAQSQKGAANKASGDQVRAAQLGIDEQRRQFDDIQKLLRPYIDSSYTALGQQGDLLGLNGSDKYQTAVQGIQNSPEFGAYTQQGEDALLQNASATGGLRGGNLEGALAQFRPSLLNQLIQQRLGNLGNVVNVGQNSAAMTGNFGANSSNNISNLFGQQGAAQAGAALATGKANAGLWNSFGNIAGGLAGFFSDPRIKRDVKFIRMDPATGLNVYEYRYKDRDEVWQGVMADEVAEKYPSAVTELENGRLMVDYSQLNLQPQIIEVTHGSH